VVAGSVAFVEMAMPAKVEEIELVNQAQMLEQLEGAVHRDASNVGIDLLRQFEDFAGIEMLRRAFHDLQDHAALAGQADAAGVEFALKAPGGFVLIDAFAGRDAVLRGDGHGRSIADREDSSGEARREKLLGLFSTVRNRALTKGEEGFFASLRMTAKNNRQAKSRVAFKAEFAHEERSLVAACDQ
jgi:hypothetical protein